MTIFAAVKKLLGILFSIILLSGSLMAQEADSLNLADTVNITFAQRLKEIRKTEEFKTRTLITGGLVFTAGAMGIDSRRYSKGLDTPVRDWMTALQDEWGNDAYR